MNTVRFLRFKSLAVCCISPFVPPSPLLPLSHIQEQVLMLISHHSIALSLPPFPLCRVWEGSRLSTWDCGATYVMTTGTLMMPMWFVGELTDHMSYTTSHMTDHMSYTTSHMTDHMSYTTSHMTDHTNYTTSHVTDHMSCSTSHMTDHMST